MGLKARLRESRVIPVAGCYFFGGVFLVVGLIRSWEVFRGDEFPWAVNNLLAEAVWLVLTATIPLGIGVTFLVCGAANALANNYLAAKVAHETALGALAYLLAHVVFGALVGDHSIAAVVRVYGAGFLMVVVIAWMPANLLFADWQEDMAGG